MMVLKLRYLKIPSGVSEKLTARFNSVRVTGKLKEWMKRYLPAEIIGTVTTLTAGMAVHHATGNLATAAVAATWAENLGFYGFCIVREGAIYFQRHRGKGRLRRASLTAALTVRSMLLEFGPAELLDTFFLRPYLMWLMPQALHNVPLGLLAGKILADVAFYGIAIIGYELKKKRRIS